MSFLDTAEAAFRLLDTPRRLSRQNDLNQLEEITRINQRVQEEFERRADARARRQTLETQRLSSLSRPGEEAARENEFQRSEIARRGQTGDTIAVLNAGFDGRERLVDKSDGNKLTAQESQQRAILAALKEAGRHDENMADRFIGNDALAPQYLNTAREMQTERIGLMRELAQMDQPTGFERVVNTMSNAVVNLAPFAVAARRIFA